MTANMSITAGVAAVEDLRAVMQGKVVSAGDEDYPRVRQDLERRGRPPAGSSGDVRNGGGREGSRSGCSRA